MYRQRFHRLALALAILAVGACDDGDVIGAAGTGAVNLEIVSGDGQQAAVGTTLSEALAVRAIDANGEPVRGAAVSFAVTAGQGEFASGSSTTGSDGIARAHWTLGAVPGTHRAEARLEGEGRTPVEFTAAASIRMASDLANAPRMSVSSNADSVAVTASWEPVRNAVAYDFEAGTASWSWRESGRVQGTDLELRAPRTDDPYWFCTVPVTARGTRLFAQVNCDQAQVKDLGRSVAEIELTPENASVEVGKTLRLTVAVLDKAGDPISREVEWSSSRPGVASVNGAGVVTAHEAGSTTITARADGIAARAAVTAVETPAAPAEPQDLTLSVEPVSDREVRLEASWPRTPGASRYLWEAGTEAGEWRDSGRTSATSLTLAAPRHAGQYVLCTVPANGAGEPVADMACAVQEVGPSDPGDPDPSDPTIVSVEVSPRAPSLRVGDTVQLTATARTSDGATIRNPEVTWTSSNSEVATVDRNGRVTARAAGMALVIATSTLSAASDTIRAEIRGNDQGFNEVIFADDFENYPVGSEVHGHGRNGFTWTRGNGNGVFVSNEQAHSGSRSLRFRFDSTPEDSHVWAEQRFRHPELQEYWVEYYLFVPRNYHHPKGTTSSTNNKFYAAWGPNGYAGSGATIFQTWAQEGSNGGSTINLNRRDRSGRDVYPRTDGNGRPMFASSDRGRWVRIRIHLRLADSNQSNGSYRLWKDNELVVRIEGDEYLVNDPSTNVYHSGYLLGSDNGRFHERTDFFIDDFQFHASNPGW